MVTKPITILTLYIVLPNNKKNLLVGLSPYPKFAMIEIPITKTRKGLFFFGKSVRPKSTSTLTNQEHLNLFYDAPDLNYQ